MSDEIELIKKFLSDLTGTPIPETAAATRIRTWRFDTGPTNFQTTITCPSLLKQMKTGLKFKVLGVNRKKIRLAKKFAKRYGLRVEYQNVFLRFETKGLSMEGSFVGSQ